MTTKPDIYPVDWLWRNEPPPLSGYARRLLAEGDSWFTIGTLNLRHASNLLYELEFKAGTAIVNCAYPGDTLQRVVDCVNDPYFDRLLRVTNFASYWEAVVLSVGGNDLIDAAQTPSILDGKPVAPEQRLLLTPAEAAAAGAPSAAERHLSQAGWARLRSYLIANLAELASRREQGPSAGRPIFLHTYAVPTARPSGTVGRPQGWLYPAFVAYGIDPALHQPITALLFGRLRDLLRELDQGSGSALALPHVHVYDSASLATIVPAAPGAPGLSNDWINEIHLRPGGYAKLGRAFGAFIDQVLSTYP